jgi:hypothetical protein
MTEKSLDAVAEPGKCKISWQPRALSVPQSSAFITRREIEHLAEYIMDQAEAQIRRAEGESQQGMDHAMAVSMATSRALRLVSKALRCIPPPPRTLAAGDPPHKA